MLQHGTLTEQRNRVWRDEQTRVKYQLFCTRNAGDKQGETEISLPSDCTSRSQIENGAGSTLAQVSAPMPGRGGGISNSLSEAPPGRLEPPPAVAGAGPKAPQNCAAGDFFGGFPVFSGIVRDYSGLFGIFRDFTVFFGIFRLGQRPWREPRAQGTARHLKAPPGRAVRFSVCDQHCWYPLPLQGTCSSLVKNGYGATY